MLRFQELEKKEAEYKKSENIGRSEFNGLCKQLGISGVKIKKELTERVVELPDIYNKLAKKVKSLDSVVEFYNAFVEFTLGSQHSGGCVPMVKYLIGKNFINSDLYNREYFLNYPCFSLSDKGNTTTYEWTYGEAPLSISEPSIDFNLDDDVEDNEENNTVRISSENKNNSSLYLKHFSIKLISVYR